jgi:hypothetical protein
LAALFVSDPEKRSPPPPLVLEKHLDISLAVARLFSFIAQGNHWTKLRIFVKFKSQRRNPT